MSLGKWEKYKVNQAEPPEQRDLGKWAKYRVSPEPEQKRSLLNRVPAWLLGLGQFGEDVTLGQAQGAGEPEVDIPEHWKPERIRKENMPEKRMPSLNLEQYVDPDEMTQFNVGRYGPAIGTALFAGGRGANALARRLGNTGVGEATLNRFQGLQHQFRNEYENFFNAATQAGVRYVPMNLAAREFNVFRRSAGRDPAIPVLDYIMDPSLRNAHDAQSALARYVRSRRGKDNSPAQNRAIEAAGDMRNQIRDSMRNAMDARRGQNNGLSERYTDISNRFREELTPYLNNKHIRAASLNPNEAGFIEPWRLPKKMQLQESDPLRRILEQQDPAFRLNRLLAGPVGKTAAGAAGLAAAPSIIKALLEQH